MNRSPIGAVLVLVILLFIPCQQLLQIEDPRWSFGSGFVLATVLYSTLRLCWISYQGRAHPVDLTFWVFVYIWMGVAPLVQLLSSRFARIPVHDASAEFVAGALLWVGIAAYELGRQIYSRRNQAGGNAAAPRFSPTAVYVVAVVALLSTPLLIVIAGGADVLLGSRGDINRAFFDGRDKSSALLLQSLLRGPPFVATLVLAYVLKFHAARLGRSSRALLWLLLLLVLPLNLLANFPTALQRFWFGTITLTYIFALISWNQRRIAQYVVILCLGLVFAFPVLDAFRKSGSSERFTESIQRAWNSPRNSLYSGDYDAYQMMMSSVVYVREQGVMYGKNLFDSAFFWFPRKYYPTKHRGSGWHVGEYFNYPFLSLAAPLWMEAYMAFGVLGVIVIMGLYGGLANRMDRHFASSVASPGQRRISVWVVSLWAGYQIFLLRGDLLSGFAYLACPLLILLAMRQWELRSPADEIPAQYPAPAMRMPPH